MNKKHMADLVKHSTNVVDYIFTKGSDLGSEKFNSLYIDLYNHLVSKFKDDLPVKIMIKRIEKANTSIDLTIGNNILPDDVIKACASKHDVEIYLYPEDNNELLIACFGRNDNIYAFQDAIINFIKNLDLTCLAKNQ